MAVVNIECSMRGPFSSNWMDIVFWFLSTAVRSNLESLEPNTSGIWSSHPGMGDFTLVASYCNTSGVMVAN
jgi:putative salt-induced outer membrane protein YdiY